MRRSAYVHMERINIFAISSTFSVLHCITSFVVSGKHVYFSIRQSSIAVDRCEQIIIWKPMEWRSCGTKTKCIHGSAASHLPRQLGAQCTLTNVAKIKDTPLHWKRRWGCVVHSYVPGIKSNPCWNKCERQFSFRAHLLLLHLHGCLLHCIASHCICNRARRYWSGCRRWLDTGHLLRWYFHHKIAIRHAVEIGNSIPLADTVHQWTFLPRKKLKCSLEKWTGIPAASVRRHGKNESNIFFSFNLDGFSIASRKMFSLFMDAVIYCRFRFAVRHSHYECRAFFSVRNR